MSVKKASRRKLNTTKRRFEHSMNICRTSGAIVPVPRCMVYVSASLLELRNRTGLLNEVFRAPTWVYCTFNLTTVRIYTLAHQESAVTHQWTHKTSITRSPRSLLNLRMLLLVREGYSYIAIDTIFQISPVYSLACKFSG